MLPQEMGKGHPSVVGGARSPSRWVELRCPVVPTARGERGVWPGWGFRKALGGAKGWRRLEFPLQLCLVLNSCYSSFV